MRLIVGPLPAAVYWRRRAVVAVALALLVLIITYACSGSSSSGAGPGGTAAGTHTPSSADPTSTLLHPTIGKPTPSATAGTPTLTPYSLPQPGLTGPCTDDEISVTATAATANIKVGAMVAFTITIKNTSTRTCARDIGAEPQELRLLDATGATIVWSSDDCNPRHDHDNQQFAPGQTFTFTLSWNGDRSRSGTGKATCGTAATTLDPADYQLVARLDKKLSAPFVLHVTT